MSIVDYILSEIDKYGENNYLIDSKDGFRVFTDIRRIVSDAKNVKLEDTDYYRQSMETDGGSVKFGTNK